MSKTVTLGSKTFVLISTDAGRSVFQETGKPFDQRSILIVAVKSPTPKRRSYISQVQVVTPILNADGLVVSKAYDTRERTIPVTMDDVSSAALAAEAFAAYSDALIAPALTSMVPII